MVDVQQFLATKAAVDSAVPFGLWAGAPALAATGVNMKNTSGYTVFAEVSGGTVTVIAVNNVVTGLTAGSFRLAPGDKIAVTYSVAPTIVWVLDGINSSAPIGAWAGAPALAASTVDMTNTSGRVLMVYVSAGTVTVIKVDGVTTGLTSGGIRLRSGSKLNITYSVAPTLAWVYS